VGLRDVMDCNRFVFLTFLWIKLKKTGSASTLPVNLQQRKCSVTGRLSQSVPEGHRPTAANWMEQREVNDGLIPSISVSPEQSPLSRVQSQTGWVGPNAGAVGDLTPTGKVFSLVCLITLSSAPHRRGAVNCSPSMKGRELMPAHREAAL
jgi:hypothetical protein